MNTSHRHTRQRQIVLEELQKVTSHPTAARLYEVVRHRLPKISLGTVYRNLELLHRLGVIAKLQMAGEEARYDGNPRRHDHIRCVQCGRVDDMAYPQLLDLPVGQVDHSTGYRILGYRLEFHGLCALCRQKRESEPSSPVPFPTDHTVPFNQPRE